MLASLNTSRSPQKYRRQRKTQMVFGREGIYLHLGLLYILCTVEPLDCWSTDRIIEPAPEAFRNKSLFSLVCPLGQYSLAMQNRGLKQHSFLL